MNIEGYTVTRVRPMTEHEMNREDWMLTANGLPPIVLDLKGPKSDDPKIIVYASTNPEGNGPGELIGTFVGNGYEQFFVKPD